jgi:hypothetical protein
MPHRMLTRDRRPVTARAIVEQVLDEVAVPLRR